ncbi:MAG TPA: hypothetical protein PLZ51_24730, partial [Aggregatilineales bacterium]|nr:hypothetical protein [Aggregatilineales bacterium]
RVSVATCDFASLSSALALVNVDGGVIDLMCSGTIAFPNELVANAHVTINGGGDVTFDGGNNTRFFMVNTAQ